MDLDSDRLAVRRKQSGALGRAQESSYTPPASMGRHAARPWACHAVVMATDVARVGAAGTFYAAAQLAQRGWHASVTIGNAPRTDIVAQHAETQRVIAVQCKTSSGRGGFLLNVGCEAPSLPGRDEWFVLVNISSPDKRPDFYVMPRNVVVAYIYVEHRTWLRGTKRDGSARRDNPARKVKLDAAAPYCERWDLLEQAEDNAPHYLPDLVFEWEPDIGLPPGHPGIARPDDGFERPHAA